MKSTDYLNIHGFKLIKTIKYTDTIYSKIYIKENICVILDSINICDVVKELTVDYSIYTETQNNYVLNLDKVFRFLEDEEDISNIIECTNINMSNMKAIFREEYYIDNSPIEEKFEEHFRNVYGNIGISALYKEYSLIDCKQNNIVIDYAIKKEKEIIGVETNGISYHHPQIIGKDRYRRQLLKQNSCAIYGMKLYRYSTQDIEFDEKIEENIKTQFGNCNEFIPKNMLDTSRGFELYEHQKNTLKEIQIARKNNKHSFLVVFATAAGKSKVAEEDILYLLKEKPNLKICIAAPSLAIQNDWINRMKKIGMTNVGETYEFQVCCCTYLYFQKLDQILKDDYFNYIVVDEAHHAVAPMLKRILQYFNPNFLLGLTATPDRLDKKRLEEVFGNYKLKLSLTDAMNNNIIAKARVLRVKSNIDLSNVRINGKNYTNSDLEKVIRVDSRNQLIVDTISEYFTKGIYENKQGLIFCVNIDHAVQLSKLLNDNNIKAHYVSGSENINIRKNKIKDYENGTVKFICSCNLISEGWDMPKTSILVMARPTMSSVVYQQQIGRGLRKFPGKDEVFILDIVDSYGPLTKPISINALFHNPFYVPFGVITERYKIGDIIEINGLVERIERIEEVDIETFEEKYADYINANELAKELFISYEMVLDWVKKQKLIPDIFLPIGNKKLPLFLKNNISDYREKFGLKEHSIETIKEDFMQFISKFDYTFSYKFIFLKSFISNLDLKGEANLDDITKTYKEFYIDRLNKNLPVDKIKCPYTAEFLNDDAKVKTSILKNPFEKYERKRFIYYSKDLCKLSMNPSLFSKLSDKDIICILDIIDKHCKQYFESIAK